jgi:hypothetical protein
MNSTIEVGSDTESIQTIMVSLTNCQGGESLMANAYFSFAEADSNGRPAGTWQNLGWTENSPCQHSIRMGIQGVPGYGGFPRIDAINLKIQVN